MWNNLWDIYMKYFVFFLSFILRNILWNILWYSAVYYFKKYFVLYFCEYYTFHIFHTRTECFNDSTHFTILYTLFHSTSLQMKSRPSVTITVIVCASDCDSEPGPTASDRPGARRGQSPAGGRSSWWSSRAHCMITGTESAYYSNWSCQWSWFRWSHNDSPVPGPRQAGRPGLLVTVGWQCQGRVSVTVPAQPAPEWLGLGPGSGRCRGRGESLPGLSSVTPTESESQWLVTWTRTAGELRALVPRHVDNFRVIRVYKLTKCSLELESGCGRLGFQVRRARVEPGHV